MKFTLLLLRKFLEGLEGCKTNTDKELHSRLAGIMAKAITDAPENIKIQAIHLAIAPDVGLTELSIAALQDKNVEVRNNLPQLSPINEPHKTIS